MDQFEELTREDIDPKRHIYTWDLEPLLQGLKERSIYSGRTDLVYSVLHIGGIARQLEDPRWHSASDVQYNIQAMVKFTPSGPQLVLQATENMAIGAFLRAPLILTLNSVCIISAKIFPVTIPSTKCGIQLAQTGSLFRVSNQFYTMNPTNSQKP